MDRKKNISTVSSVCIIIGWLDVVVNTNRGQESYRRHLHAFIPKKRGLAINMPRSVNALLSLEQSRDRVSGLFTNVYPVLDAKW